MGRFTQNFGGRGVSYGDWNIHNVLDNGLSAIYNQLQDNVKAGAKKASSSVLHKEVDFALEYIGKQTDYIINAADRNSEDIVSAISTMSSYLDAGLCRIQWSLEQITDNNKKILEVMLNSLDNKSRQYFEQGVKSYNENEFEIAKERFEKALEANKTNYFAYQYLGFVAVQKDESETAIRNFELATKFAPNDHYKALALSHWARGMHSLDKHSEAADLSAKSTEAEPISRFWYEYAGYCTKAGRTNESLMALYNTINNDLTYFAIAATDDTFDPIKENVDKLLNKLREEEKSLAVSHIENLKNTISLVNKVGLELYIDGYIDIDEKTKATDNEYYKAQTKKLEEEVAGENVYRFKLASRAAESLIKKIIPGLHERVLLKQQFIDDKLSKYECLERERVRDSVDPDIVGKVATTTCVTSTGAWLLYYIPSLVMAVQKPFEQGREQFQESVAALLCTPIISGLTFYVAGAPLGKIYEMYLKYKKSKATVNLQIELRNRNLAATNEKSRLDELLAKLPEGYKKLSKE